MEFAQVSVCRSILIVRALRPRPTEAEFARTIALCESAYTSMQRPFVLAMDLMDMEEVSVPQALAWMAMFLRVMPTTKRFLVCTCACFPPSLKNAVDLFLKLYDPVKPFLTCSTREEMDLRAKHAADP